jgi:hypothetical protein
VVPPPLDPLLAPLEPLLPLLPLEAPGSGSVPGPPLVAPPGSMVVDVPLHAITDAEAATSATTKDERRMLPGSYAGAWELLPHSHVMLKRAVHTSMPCTELSRSNGWTSTDVFIAPAADITTGMNPSAIVASHGATGFGMPCAEAS